MLLIKLKQFSQRGKETWRPTTVPACNEWELIFIKGGNRSREEGVHHWSVSNPRFHLENYRKGVLYWNNYSE